MTNSEIQASEPHRGPQRQTSLQILSRALTLYKQHWRPFTRVLLAPVVEIFIGLYASLALSQGFINWLTACCQTLIADNLWLAIGSVLLIVLACLSLTVRGTWRYLIYWATLCENAWEADQGEYIDFERAREQFLLHKQTAYSILATTYFSLPIIALIPILLMTALGLFLGENLLQLLMVAGGLQSLILLTCWGFSLILLSFVFQVAAFEKGIPLNPSPTFILSVKLALKRFSTTMCLQAAVFLLTNVLAPLPIIWLGRLTTISTLLDWLHLQLFGEAIRQCQTIMGGVPLLSDVVQGPGFVTAMVQASTDLTLSFLITLLLLPFGTFAFTLLYKDILKCDRSKKTFLGI